MPKQTRPAITPDEPKKAKRGFDPASLSKDEQEAVIEFYFGVHPDYFQYEGHAIKVDQYRLAMAGGSFSDWKCR